MSLEVPTLCSGTLVLLPPSIRVLTSFTHILQMYGNRAASGQTERYENPDLHDNWLFPTASRQEAEAHTALVFQHVTQLGFMINPSKSTAAKPTDALPQAASGLPHYDCTSVRGADGGYPTGYPTDLKP